MRPQFYITFEKPLKFTPLENGLMCVKIYQNYSDVHFRFPDSKTYDADQQFTYKLASRLALQPLLAAEYHNSSCN
jgi:hypothetical protein